MALVAVTLWLGAALFLAVAVAPAAFAVLPTRAIAGELIGKILPLILLTGVIVGCAVLVLVLAGPRRKHWLVTGIGAILVAFACSVAQFGIAPRIARVRNEAGAAFDTLAADSAVRIEFGRLHRMSVAWLGVAILGATSVVLLSGLALSRGQETPGSGPSPDDPSSQRKRGPSVVQQ